MNEQKFPKRKPTRLKSFDYSKDGAYFVTICTKDKASLLSEITGVNKYSSVPFGENNAIDQSATSPTIRLTECGKIAHQQIISIDEQFSCVKVDKFVIMPNHIHLIIIIYHSRDLAGGASPSPTLSDVICAFKSQTTRICKSNGHFKKDSLFQRSFHDHIIRTRKSYLEISHYIENNPAHWQEDCFYNER